MPWRTTTDRTEKPRAMMSAFFGFWLASWTVFLRLRSVPSVAGGSDATVPPLESGISLIIPARNEEENLATLLPSIAEQDPPPLEIIVVDDHSADATASVARDHGATVLASEALPEGWYGKPWALVQGARAAKGEWLLFLDADTALESGGLTRLAALTVAKDTVFSACPWHRIEKPFEELCAFFNVIMLAGTNAFTWRGFDTEPIALFGQAMLVRKRDYERVGTHGRVKAVVLENLHLARHFEELGIRCRSYLGKGTLRMRMFPGGYAEMEKSWAKGFLSGAGNTPRGALIGVSLWLSALIMATIALTFLPLAGEAVRIAVAGFYLVCAGQCAYLFRKAGRFSPLNALFFPVSLIYYQWLFFLSAHRRRKGLTTDWKGRDVH